MVSETTKVFTVLIALGIVLAGSVFFLKRTEADRMLISSYDVDPGWLEEDRFSYNYPADYPFNKNSTSIEYVIMSKNSSIIAAHLIEFKSSKDSLEEYWQLWNHFSAGGWSDVMIEEIAIGDQGYLQCFHVSDEFPIPPNLQGQFGSTYVANLWFSMPNNRIFYALTSNFMELTFTKGNILASIVVLVQGDVPTQHWIPDFIMSLGWAQLQKIDRYA